MADDRPEPQTIHVEGPVTLYEAAVLRETLREALADGGDVCIDLGGSGKWDLSGLQVLISCQKTCHEQGRSMTLSKIPRVCVDIAQRSGLKEWLEALAV